MPWTEKQSFVEPHRSHRSADQDVEQLVSDIGGVIRSVAPEKRSELKEFAEVLFRDEISSIAEESTSTQASSAAAQRFNPLLPGILLALLGLGFFLLFPLVGLALAAIGAALVMWGAVLSWLRK